MPSKFDARLAARQYTDENERKAFGVGYGAGYHQHCLAFQNPRTDGEWYLNYPNAYSAGYWEGVADRSKQR
jgi:hypothetical protein